MWKYERITMHLCGGDKHVKLQGRSKDLAKFSDTCSVRADGLCIGLTRLVSGIKALNIRYFLLAPNEITLQRHHPVALPAEPLMMECSSGDHNGKGGKVEVRGEQSEVVRSHCFPGKVVVAGFGSSSLFHGGRGKQVHMTSTKCPGSSIPLTFRHISTNLPLP